MKRVKESVIPGIWWALRGTLGLMSPWWFLVVYLNHIFSLAAAASVMSAYILILGLAYVLDLS